MPSQNNKNTMYTSNYASPLGDILLSADDEGLTGLWFVGQKYFAKGLSDDTVCMEVSVLKNAKEWLDIYFSGRKPDFSVPLHPAGTEFQREVWNILCSIPYGSTVTYGEIAARLCEKRGLSHMSPQAVGGAVGHNRISIIIPCHRVVGADGSLTGYAGGVEKKLRLLELEGVRISSDAWKKISIHDNIK